MVLHALRTDARADAPPRVGLVVSKAVGTAVVRNRTKRRLRALMAPRVRTIPGGYDVVIRANPPAAQATYAELGADLDRLLGRVLDGPVPHRPVPHRPVRTETDGRERPETDGRERPEGAR